MIEQILQDSEMKFNELEKRVFQFTSMLGCAILKTVLERRDREILKSRDKKKYRHKGYKRDCIKTIMGEVEYKRAIYEVRADGDKIYEFLLDKDIEISKTGKISTNLCEKIINNVCENSYRVCAKNISDSTNQVISHEGVRQIVLEAGQKIYQKEKEKVKLLKDEKLKSGEKEIPVLFEEADGLWVSLQGKDRENAIKHQKSMSQKTEKKYKQPRKVKSELKIYVSYEGWEKGERHALIGKQYITGFIKSKDLSKIRKAKLYERYNLKKLKLMILNGDGASWIKKLALKGEIYQKDSFHIEQAITRCIKEPEYRDSLRNLIKEKKYNEINNYLESLKYETGGEEKQVKKLARLQCYLSDGLARYIEQVKEMPEPPEGMEYRGMGTCESQVFCVLTKRFSGRRMSFSKYGATMLSKVVALKVESKGKGILEVVEAPIKIGNIDWLDIDESAKNNKKEKLKPPIPIKVVKKPFEGAALSESLKAIRGLTNLLPLSGLI